MKIAARAAFGMATVVILYVVLRPMVALSWTVDAVIAAVAVVAFAYFFERGEPKP